MCESRPKDSQVVTWYSLHLDSEVDKMVGLTARTPSKDFPAGTFDYFRGIVIE